VPPCLGSRIPELYFVYYLTLKLKAFQTFETLVKCRLKQHNISEDSVYFALTNEVKKFRTIIPDIQSCDYWLQSRCFTTSYYVFHFLIVLCGYPRHLAWNAGKYCALFTTLGLLHIHCLTSPLMRPGVA